VEVGTFISIWAYASILIVDGAVDVRTVVESAVSPLHRSPPPLVHEVPVETGEWPMLVTLVLQEGFALLYTKFLQVPEEVG